MKTTSLQILLVAIILGKIYSLTATPEQPAKIDPIEALLEKYFSSKQPPTAKAPDYSVRSSRNQIRLLFGIFPVGIERVNTGCSWSRKPTNPHEWLVRCKKQVDGETKEETTYTVKLPKNEYGPQILTKDGMPVFVHPIFAAANAIAAQKCAENAVRNYTVAFRLGESLIATTIFTACVKIWLGI